MNTSTPSSVASAQNSDTARLYQLERFTIKRDNVFKTLDCFRVFLHSLDATEEYPQIDSRLTSIEPLLQAFEDAQGEIEFLQSLKDETIEDMDYHALTEQQYYSLIAMAVAATIFLRRLKGPKSRVF